MKPSTLPTILRTSPRVHFKNILFATDLGSASAQAQAYAVLLARMFGSHLFILHVEAGLGLSPRYKGAAPSPDQEAGKVSGPGIDELEMFFRASGVPYTLLLERGEVHDALNRVVEKCSIDLIILGSHGRHGVSYLFMGSTAENVARSSRCPVITVGPQAHAGFENSLKTIIFATDFSEESKLALPYATSLAQEFRANLTVLHVAPKRERLIRDREQVEGYLLNQLKSLAPQGHFPWCAVSHVVTFGNTAQEILDAATDRKADLIVLGLHSAVRFTSHVPERLSYRVLCDAPCPVMSVLPGRSDLKLAQLAGSFLASASHAN
jgi:nucleotide-binding universal stress UspA family protein